MKIQDLLNTCDFFEKIASQHNNDNSIENSIVPIIDDSIKKEITDFEKTISTYMDKPNTFIHFSNNENFGFNMNTVFTMTPFGIYGYPLTSKLFFELAKFAIDRKYIHIFKCLGKKLDTANYTDKNFQKDVENLKQIFPNDNITQIASLYEYKKTPAHKILQLSQKLAKYDPFEWTKLLMSLGYDFIVDSNASGAIHPSEPYQAVCLINPGKSNFKLLKTILNDLNKLKTTLYDCSKTKDYTRSIPDKSIKK